MFLTCFEVFLWCFEVFLCRHTLPGCREGGGRDRVEIGDFLANAINRGAERVGAGRRAPPQRAAGQNRATPRRARSPPHISPPGQRLRAPSPLSPSSRGRSRVAARRRVPPAPRRRRPPLARGPAGADPSPLPLPPRAALLPTIPRAGRARAALEPPVPAPFPPPPPGSPQRPPGSRGAEGRRGRPRLGAPEFFFFFGGGEPWLRRPLEGVCGGAGSLRLLNIAGALPLYRTSRQRLSGNET